MSIEFLGGLLLVGLAAGSLSGLLGIGGGVILVPALVFLFGLTQHAAQGTTLALMVPPIGLLAALNYYRKGEVDLRVAALVCTGFAAGGYAGAVLATSLSSALLQRVFGIGLAGIAVKALAGSRNEQPDTAVHTARRRMTVPITAGLILLGFLVGNVSGLIGVGGGILLVPGLVFFFGFSQQEAQGTTLALMVPPIGLPAALQYAHEGHLNFGMAAVIAAGFFLGGFFGARAAHVLSTRTLTKIFGIGMLAIAAKMLFA